MHACHRLSLCNTWGTEVLLFSSCCPCHQGEVQVKVNYIAQYPITSTVQSVLHFTSLTDLLTQTPSQLLWEVSSHTLQLMCKDCSYTYPPLSKARYSFIQLSELEQCRVKKLAQAFSTAAQDSNPGPLI